MKAKVTKQKSLRERIIGYGASIGPIEASGKTPAQAVEACEKAVAEALERLDHGAIVKRWNGHTIVVSPDAHGWRYWIDALSRPDTYVTVHGSCQNAIDAALMHAAQCAWEPDVDDAAFLASVPVLEAKERLVSWIRFQRGYIAAKASGLNDHEAHRAACEARAS